MNIIRIDMTNRGILVNVPLGHLAMGRLSSLAVIELRQFRLCSNIHLTIFRIVLIVSRQTTQTSIDSAE